jgi:hypothetical protein
MIIPLLAIFNKDSPIITTILLICIQFVKFDQILSYLKKISFKKKTQFTVKANVAYRYNRLWSADYSTSFLALCRSIKLSISNESNSNYEIKEFPREHSKENIMFFDLRSKYRITPDIYITTNIVTYQNDTNDNEYSVLNITLETKSDFNKLHDFINNCKKEYEYELLDNIKTQHVFIFKSVNDEDFKNIYEEHPFDTTKSFDNMFFDEKEKLIKKLDWFINKKSEYKRLGIPYTLGILLHGLAGTGKTSCLKSIAQYTGRHIVVLPTKNIKNISTLQSIFMNEYINDTFIPNYKRLYVFEDIDCGSWKDIVISRDLKNPATDNKSVIETQAVLDVLSKIKDKIKDKKKDNDIPNIELNTLTLGDFLELLDGIMEISGRMIVMTSNHPETLDPALVRPGRIDINIKFKKLSKLNVAQIYKQWFTEDIDTHVYETMKDNVFTQADIGNIFSQLNKSDIYKELTQF